MLTRKMSCKAGTLHMGHAKHVDRFHVARPFSFWAFSMNSWIQDNPNENAFNYLTQPPATQPSSRFLHPRHLASQRGPDELGPLHEDFTDSTDLHAYTPTSDHIRIRTADGVSLLAGWPHRIKEPGGEFLFIWFFVFLFFCFLFL